MEDLDEIQSELKRGDKQRIADLTHSSLDTVVKVLKGERPSDTDKGRLIVFAATTLIKQREELREMISERRKALQTLRKWPT